MPGTLDMKNFYAIAAIVSALFAIPISAASLTIAYSSQGTAMELIWHPGFWDMFFRAWRWVAFAGVLSSWSAYWLFKRVSSAT